MSIRFPGESPAYRTARDELLKAEMELRRKVEEVASLRRRLPLGGEVPTDYVFDEGPADPGGTGPARTVKLSELFGKKNTLVLYCFMYGPAMKAPCPLCTSFLDGLAGNADHIRQNVALAVVARSLIERIREFARGRSWSPLRLVSSANNTFHGDYHGATKDGAQMPMANVFVKRDGRVHHFWGAELVSAHGEDGLDSRHIDMAWPLWNVLDWTPDGRGTTWYPALKYDE